MIFDLDDEFPLIKIFFAIKFLCTSPEIKENSNFLKERDGIINELNHVDVNT